MGFICKTTMPISPARWTIDENGCAVVQLPVPWTSTRGAPTTCRRHSRPWSGLSRPCQNLTFWTSGTATACLFILMKTTSSQVERLDLHHESRT